MWASFRFVDESMAIFPDRLWQQFGQLVKQVFAS